MPLRRLRWRRNLLPAPRNPPYSSPRSRLSRSPSDRALRVGQTHHLQHNQTGEETLSDGLVRTNSFIPRLSSPPTTLSVLCQEEPGITVLFLLFFFFFLSRSLPNTHASAYTEESVVGFFFYSLSLSLLLLLLLLSSRANPEPGPGLPLRCSLAHKHKTAFIILPVAAQGLASKSY